MALFVVNFYLGNLRLKIGQSCFYLFYLWFVLLVAFQTSALSEPLEEQSNLEHLIISTVSGEHKFQIELAQTSNQRRQGLQYRKNLSLNKGMLFVFDFIAPTRMWMKNTFISLDMLFLSSDGRIIKIAEKTDPLSLNAISSIDPVKGVLEISAGSAERLEIKEGDRVHHSAFRNTQ